MIVRGPQKKYVGAISSELRAARLYDKFSLIVQGFQVKFIFFSYKPILGENKFLLHLAGANGYARRRR